eukprot:10641941-Ditylum_brightwellii.AAC.1
MPYQDMCSISSLPTDHHFHGLVVRLIAVCPLDGASLLWDLKVFGFGLRDGKPFNRILTDIRSPGGRFLIGLSSFVGVDVPEMPVK